MHGDRWAKGCWKSTADGLPHPDVQICIMNARCIALIAGERGNWAPAGDNLFIDLDLTPDNTPPGTRLAIGTAVIEITDTPHNGCDSFIAALWARCLPVREHRGGQAAAPAGDLRARGAGRTGQCGGRGEEADRGDSGSGRNES